MDEGNMSIIPRSSVSELTEENQVFKKPLPKVRKKYKVLDEETYLEKIGEIIERDFFPDLKKLNAQNEYLDAIEKNDGFKLRQIFSKYSLGRPNTDNTASPSTFETPASTKDGEGDDIKPDVRVKLSEEEDAKNSKKTEVDCRAKSLDQFLGQYTSEDNQSFEEIIQETQQRNQANHPWLYKEEQERLSGALPVPSIEYQAACIEKPANVDTWGYKNKNYIMYTPEGAELTEEEKSHIIANREKVVHANTRLGKVAYEAKPTKVVNLQGYVCPRSRLGEGKIGVDGKEILLSSTPKVNGFSFVKTPSPAPGLYDSPLMTWGQIEGTPFRLDGGDTPLRTSHAGPVFKINEPPTREKLAHALADKVGEKYRDKKQKAIEAAKRQIALSSPSIACSPMERFNAMSPAAQRLASTHIKRIGTDVSLRTSYSPKIARTPKQSATPKYLVKTPKITTSKTPMKKPAVEAATPKPTNNLTDNLLNLPKKPRAADFF